MNSPLKKGGSRGGVKNNHENLLQPKLKKLARELRNNSTLTEVLLWNQLKSRKMKGYQFMRQKPIDNYIVDFFCSKLKLIIEIDGASHNEKAEQDNERQRKLESFGLSFLRFYDFDIKYNMQGVMQMLESWIDEFERHNPLAPFDKGELNIEDTGKTSYKDFLKQQLF